MEKKKIIALIISILMLISVVIGFSYAYLKKSSTQTGDNILSTISCLEAKIISETAAINLENALPTPEVDGLKLAGYTFRVRNNCSNKIKVEMNLESLEVENPIPLNLINYSLNGKPPVPLSSRVTVTPAQNAGATSKNIYTTAFNPNEEKEYNLKLWLNNSATISNALNKNFQGKIVVSAVVTNFKCLDKPNDFTSAPTGTILAKLNSNNYCYSEPLTVPGRQVTTETEAIISSTVDDYGTSYYFRGNVENNNVVFANMCWKIVRIMGNDNTNGEYNNATKLVLHNSNPNNAINPCNVYGAKLAYATNSSNQIVNSAFNNVNSIHQRNAGIGFMYGSNATNATYEQAHVNTTNSATLNSLITWYNLKLADYSAYLADTIWCNDKRVGSTGTGAGTTVTRYKGYDRLNTASTASPDLRCGENKQDNMISKFTASNSTDGEYGNGALNGYKIGLLTADEMAFSGYTYNGTANPAFLASNTNASNWFTLTPFSFESSNARMFIVSSNITTVNKIYFGNAGSAYEIRPSISLKADIKVTGSGTNIDPYVVQPLS